MVALLDVNVLISLLDPAHPSHEGAHGVLSNQAYPTARTRPEEVVMRLQQACRSPHHEFWSDATTLLDPSMFRTELIGSHLKVTDVCLLALACRNQGRLVTFDRSIPLKTVVGAKPEHLLAIGGPLR